MINCIFLLVLIIASAMDIKTKRLPNALSLVVLALGFFSTNEFKLLGLIVTGLPLYIANLVKVDCTGGGDVKLMAACGFFLGGLNGVFALIIGLACAVVVVPIWRKIRKISKNQPYALFPFLGTGCATVLFLGGYFIT